MKTAGIHHISAVVGHPQENIDFYAGVLGLRMIKKTVNFDDPGTYHLYFGDEAGTPGTIMTFFPWENARQGRIGTGQVGVTSFVVPVGALPFWMERLEKHHVPFEKQERFGEESLLFEDPHGLKVEIVARELGKKNEWTHDTITKDEAIKGFGGATLYSSQPEKTAHLLEHVLGMERVGEEGSIIRFRTPSDLGNMVDIDTSVTTRGLMGAGTVHHIAWRAEDDENQLDWKSHVEQNGYGVTPVQDRNYFNAIYFREHGEILFEIATDPPGFLIDEPFEQLGDNLKLPPQYEPHRQQIEDILIPVKVPR
ncbi:ring-cleaving dioxygenase [Metabacillus iocasae]|uniref:Glyoxalase family protein n=1 Tax=Priestia iocasae TaxID=2291674 RepID=A0ABS2QVN1_9BACI|nr:ring-cleaving dioxygenase [Metabacillus iocasae]MBM7703057.1 glyoxalase family protein [Metabacillus iocasae]